MKRDMTPQKFARLHNIILSDVQLYMSVTGKVPESVNQVTFVTDRYRRNGETKQTELIIPEGKPELILNAIASIDLPSSLDYLENDAPIKFPVPRVRKSAKK